MAERQSYRASLITGEPIKPSPKLNPTNIIEDAILLAVLGLACFAIGFLFSQFLSAL